MLNANDNFCTYSHTSDVLLILMSCHIFMMCVNNDVFVL